MSWLKTNYHLAALGGGAIALLGLGYLAYSSYEETTANLAQSGGSKKTTTTVQGVDEVKETIASLTAMDKLEGKTTSSGRPVNLFTSVDLYTEADDPSKMVDLLKMSGPVHPPIDNQWWVDNRIEPSFSDSPQRDEDGDGFTNLEEYEAKTDPNDPDSYGDLLSKLEVVKVESAAWLLKFNSVVGNGYQFRFDYIGANGKRGQSRMGAAEVVQVGDTIFKDGAGKDRFKILKIEDREVEGAAGARKVQWATMQDLMENKKMRTYDIPYGMKARNRAQFTFFDHTITFRLNAVGASDQEFAVVENGKFSLPAGKEPKNYQLIDVKMDGINVTSVVVEHSANGKTETREIPITQ